MKFWNQLFLIGLSNICVFAAAAFEIGVGASINNKYLNVFNENGAEIAGLQGDSGLWPYVSIKTKDKYFGDSSFGYFYYGWYTQDAVDKVKNHEDRVLPSRVKLAFLYAGATIFYVFGDRLITPENGKSQHAIGIGAGLGASNIDGYIPAAYTNTGIAEKIDSNLTGSSANIFYRYLWGQMFVIFDASSVQVNNGNRKYETTETSLTLGRYFDF